MAEVFERYRNLSGKHQLPDFPAIDHEFEISTIESGKFLLREIIGRMVGKIDYYSMLIESVLQPDTANVAAMHECRLLTEEDKQELYGLYKRLMTFSRRAVELSLVRDDAKDAEYIIQFFGEWKDIKRKLLPFVTRMKDSWKDEAAIKEELGYFG